MSIYDDQTWIRLLKQGDEQALGDLYKALFELSNKACEIKGLDEQFAQEAADHAYDRLLKSGIHNFDFRRPFCNYFYTIVSREIIRLYKKYKREIDSLVGQEEILVGTITFPYGRVLEILKPCLDKLSERAQVCIRAYYLDEEAPEDIAEKIGISRTYVNVINYQARLQLKKCMTGRGYGQIGDIMESLPVL
jgi:RNA polymerase sigma factor (sigma-70 family)